MTTPTPIEALRQIREHCDGNNWIGGENIYLSRKWIIKLCRETLAAYEAQHLTEEDNTMTTPTPTECALALLALANWKDAPQKAEWGAGMMVADVALTKDETMTIYVHSSALDAAQPQEPLSQWCSCEPTRCEGGAGCRWWAAIFARAIESAVMEKGK